MTDHGVKAVEKNVRYVLVADTNAADRFSTCMLLQQFGCNIFAASTVEEAIEFMNVTPPAAVVADADLAGSTLLPLMKKDPHFSGIPLILLVSPKTELQQQEGEYTAFLKKPINVDEFYRVVQSVIKNGSRRNIRIPTHLTATLEDVSSGSVGHVTVLSEDGMFFRSPDPLPPNTRIPVSFEINGRVILLEAIVLYSTTINKIPSNQPGMGMRFDRISPVDRELIKTFILDRIKDGMSRQNNFNC